jgi:hypothetical protein
VTDNSEVLSELRRFIFDGLPTLGVLTETPQYGLVDLLLPDNVAARLDGRSFLRLALTPEAVTGDGSAEYLGYGSALLDRLLALTRDSAAGAHWYVRGLQHPPKDLRAEAARQLSFPNAWIVQEPRGEDIAYHNAAIFWFRATILSHEKREYLAPVAIDLHSHRPLSPQMLMLANLDADGDPFVPIAPPWTPPDGKPATDIEQALDQAQQQAAHQVEQSLAGELTAATERSARRLEATRSRLESFYDDMAHGLQLRMRRAEDEKKDTFQARLAAVAAEREKKLREAGEQYRVRLVLNLVAAALVTRPMPTTSIVVENRYASATLNIAWDTLGKVLDAPVCQICQRPSPVLHLCGNGHLVCPADIIHCSACKREYCRQCGMGECVVDHAPLCSHHPACPVCGKSVCPEHQGLCHAPAPAPQLPAKPREEKQVAAPKPRPTTRARAPAPVHRLPPGIPPSLTPWELMRWGIHPGFARLRQEDRRLNPPPPTPAAITNAIRQAGTIPQLQSLMDRMYDDVWDIWAEKVARYGVAALEVLHGLVGSPHPANRTVGAMVVSHLAPGDVPLALDSLSRLPPDIQATIAVGLGCSPAARSVPAVGDTLWRLAGKLYRNINQINAHACWAMMLALNDLDDPRRDDALAMALTRVGVAHLPHLLLVIAARGTPKATQALLGFAPAQLGTDLERQVIQALRELATRQGAAVLDALDAMPSAQTLRNATSRPDFDVVYALPRVVTDLVPEGW